jgi:hypothetical protein
VPVARRELLDRLALPEPCRETVDTGLALIDDSDERIAQINRHCASRAPIAPTSR